MLQVAVIATGVLVPAMYFLGLLFAGVWVYLLWVRQEVTRAGTRTAAGLSAAPPRAPGATTTYALASPYRTEGVPWTPSAPSS